MLRFIDITRVYKTSKIETIALDRFNLEVETGEFVAIVGDSGSGKSTFLNIAGLIDKPDSGHYEFFDQDVSAARQSVLTRIRRESIGFIFQNFNLIDEMTVGQNVELPLKYNRSPVMKRSKRVREVLEMVGLSHRLNHYPRELSGGQQQRVAIARAVVHAPKLLIADEPTGNLDTENGQAVLDLLSALNDAGTTILMVTHSKSQQSVADRVIELRDGRRMDSNRPDVSAGAS